MIPRAEVYTSSDVTVEELRGEGEERTLRLRPWPNGSANRRRSSPARTDPSATGVLLAIDVGNTQTVAGLFEGSDLREHWRLATDRERTGDELGVLITGLLDPDEVDGVSLSSSVPPLVREYEAVADRWLRARF